MAEPDDCDCIVCAVRRGVDHRYPSGVNADAAQEIAADLGGVMGALAAKFGPPVTIAFFTALTKTAGMFDDEGKERPQ